jgi:putative addiction module component (TIGR02574 family)
VDPNDDSEFPAEFDRGQETMSQLTVPESVDRDSLRLSEYRKLSIDDRIQLVQEIWDSIAADSTGALHVPDWHDEELGRRYREYLKDGDRGRTWEEVKQAILERRCLRTS